MKNLKRDAIGLLGCLAIIVVAVLLHRYVIRQEAASIRLFGYALDAIIAAGVVSNLIIFLLVKATHGSTFRIALWSLLIVNGALLLIAILIGNFVEAPFYFLPVFLSYVVSFIFWLAIHWIWSRTKTSTEPLA